VLVERVRGIAWFGKCGEALPSYGIPVRAVHSWSEAEIANSSDLWENVQLEFRNRLTLFLHKHAPGLDLHWNNITERAKREVVTPLERGTWGPLVKKLNLSEEVLHSVRWDILAALMESAYREVPNRPVFFLNLVDVYESGHFPCGWIGSADAPDGELLVY